MIRRNFQCLSFFLLLAHLADAKDREKFPTSQMEISVCIMRDDQGGMQILTSWLTRDDCQHVIECITRYDETWVPVSEVFDGDGLPVVFLDRISYNEMFVSYRMVTITPDDQQWSSPLHMGLMKNEVGNYQPIVSYGASANVGFLLEYSYDLAKWAAAVVIRRDNNKQVEMVDNPLPLGQERFYRLSPEKTDGVDTEPSKDFIETQRIIDQSINEYVVNTEIILLEDLPFPLNRRLGKVFNDEALKDMPRVLRSLRFEHPIIVEEAGTNYVQFILKTQDAKVTSVNDLGHVMLARKMEDGRIAMVIEDWSRQPVDFSKLDGIYYDRLLDLSNDGKALGTVIEDGKEYAVGIAYTLGDNPTSRPLTEEEIISFRLVDPITVNLGPIYINGRRFIANPDQPGSYKFAE